MSAGALLFVYGTLMREEPSHRRIAAASRCRVEPASTEGRLYALAEGYPALIPRADDPSNAPIDLVFGELCEIEALDALLPELDRFEGFDPSDPEGSLFVRVILSIRTETNRLVRAYAYVMRADREPDLIQSGALRIPTGRWSSRHLSAKSR